jgi:hypothetical protein
MGFFLYQKQYFKLIQSSFNKLLDIIFYLFTKGLVILNNHFLQQQIATEQDRNSIYNSLPVDIRTTLDDMSYGIAIKENLEPFIVKQRMVSKLNMLPNDKAIYLVENMAQLIYMSVQENQTIDDKNVQKQFLDFLISLYY